VPPRCGTFVRPDTALLRIGGLVLGNALLVRRSVKKAIDSWAVGTGINAGPLLRSIKKAGRIWGNGFTQEVIWAIVKATARSCGLPSVVPHDLRRTCARLCYWAGGELDQIQFLLGHVSIQTTERYLGCPCIATRGVKPLAQVSKNSTSRAGAVCCTSAHVCPHMAFPTCDLRNPFRISTALFHAKRRYLLNSTF
jgi:hypothetical protein